VDQGNYDFVLTYDEDDELGRLTRSFKMLSDNVKTHISELNGQVFFDALTHVKNKGAFSKALEDLQEQIDQGEDAPEFAIGVFDCDSLKTINDKYGHVKGDIYLKKACSTICDVFKHCPVFRIGGDEFAVIIQKADYNNMESLMEQFDKTAIEINASKVDPWEKVKVSKGFAVYKSSQDSTALGVMQRADKLMYENKRDRKNSQ
jgi:diguanylate cyclase (GGDEF)-like protein